MAVCSLELTIAEALGAEDGQEPGEIVGRGRDEPWNCDLALLRVRHRTPEHLVGQLPAAVVLAPPDGLEPPIATTLDWYADAV